MPLLKRLFGQGKSKGSSGLTALCIGDYSRLTLPLWGLDARQLEALLANETAEDDGSPGSPSNLPTPQSTKTSPLGGQASFKGLRQLLQHLGGGASAKDATPQAEVECHRHLTQLIKQLGGLSEVSFISAAEDGVLYREKVLTKLTKLFKQSTAPVVVVSYCGPSDERGNWRLASHAALSGGASSGAGGVGLSTAIHNGGSSGGGGCGGAVVSFREVSMLWQRHRKHSQRLVLLLDCANSGYWVAALRMLSKAEQLELSLGVQASDSCLPAAQGRQMTYLPGIFTQLFFTNNKWRREHRRAAPLASQQQQQTQSPASSNHFSSSAAAAGGGGGGGGGSVNSSVRGGRAEQWLPGMMPSYYATWLNDNLVDYGIALRFFNLQAPAVSPGDSLRSVDAAADAAAAAGATAPRTMPAAAPVPAAPVSSSMGSPPDPVQVWRASTMLLAGVDSMKMLHHAVTAPAMDPWVTMTPSVPALAAAATGPVGAEDAGEDARTSSERIAARAGMALRAPSVPDTSRRRYSSHADYYAITNAEAFTSKAAAVNRPSATVTGSTVPPGCQPAHSGSGDSRSPSLHHRLQVQAADRPACNSAPLEDGWSPAAIAAHVFRAPTLPGVELVTRAGMLAGPGAGSATSPDISITRSSAAAIGGTTSCPPPDLGSSPSRISGVIEVGGGSSCLLARTAATAVAASAETLQHPPSLHPPPPSLLLPQQPESQPQTQPSPPSAFCAAAFHPWDSSVDGYYGCPATAAAAGNTGASNDLAIQASAQSDSAVMQWDRRSNRAGGGQLLLAEECVGAAASSFTGPNQRGFAHELLGALREVATERRLWARRAPLEGDEPLDIMMQDADIERNISVSSLPSVLLAHDMLGGGASASSATPSTLPPPPPVSVVLAAGRASNSGAGASGGGGGRTLGLITPRSSVLGMQQQQPGMGGLASGRQSNVGMRQLSRLFTMSMAAAAIGGGVPVAGFAGLVDALGSLQQSYEGDREEEGLLIVADSQQQQQVQTLEQQEQKAELLRQLQRQQQPQVLHGFYGGGGGRTEDGSGSPAVGNGGDGDGDGGGFGAGFLDTSTSLLAGQTADSAAGVPSEAVAEGQAEPGWLHSSTQSLTPMPSGRERARLARASAVAHSSGGPATSSQMLRNILKQRVSIADSVDLDAVTAGSPPTWQRRPGRFEMAGSETSSFVFGDDRERFEMLRMMREAEEDIGGGGGGAGAANGDCDISDMQAGTGCGQNISNQGSAILAGDEFQELLMQGHDVGGSGSVALGAGGFLGHSLEGDLGRNASASAVAQEVATMAADYGCALLLSMNSDVGEARVEGPSGAGALWEGDGVGSEEFGQEAASGEPCTAAADAVVEEEDVCLRII